LKLKNKESFARKGAQTISRFKSNALVSTSFNKEVDSGMEDKKINCLNYVISDSYIGKKAKTDDIFVQTQKMLDKKVRKELKQTLKHTKDLLSVDSSTLTGAHQDGEASESGADSIISSSMQSSQKPKGSKLNALGSHEKSNTNKERPSPSSSFAQASKNSETQVTKSAPEPVVNNQVVKHAFNEELPKTIVYPLKYVERLLSQNQFHFRQIAYKDYPISKEEFEVKTKKKATDFASMGLGGDNIKEDDQATKNMQKEIALIIDNTNEPNIKKLFTYSVDILLQENNITSKYVVHAMDWNRNNPDLLAAVYGDPDINSKQPGFLCFWTLKNPLHPERVIKTQRGLTYCNFSRRNPYLIVVSDYQGEIMIFDLRNNSNKPIADSSEVKDKHTDIVWECKWIERPNDKNEIIITTSSDGKIKEWSLKKGLEVTDLLKMKKSTSFPMKQLNPFAKYLKKDRTINTKDNKEIKETLIFRDANGLSFDFPKNDTTIYYVALEECTVHKCRISYKDQYIDNYYGHQGPVYKIRCNPFDPNILISCSYDWTVKIWNSKHNYPVMNLHTNELSHQVNDIEWNSDTSTVFGDVADDGRIEIWDLARSAIQPIIINIDDKAPKKSIKFSEGGKIVAAGDSEGCIAIYRIYNMEHSPVSDEHQVKRLQGIIQQNSDISSKI
jgi:WD40 repeat protein